MMKKIMTPFHIANGSLSFGVYLNSGLGNGFVAFGLGMVVISMIYVSILPLVGMLNE